MASTRRAAGTPSAAPATARAPSLAYASATVATCGECNKNQLLAHFRVSNCRIFVLSHQSTTGASKCGTNQKHEALFNW